MTKLFSGIFLSIICLSGCNSDNNKKIEETDLLSYRSCFSIQPITKPIALGDSVLIQVDAMDATKKFDSTEYQIDGIRWQKFAGNLTGTTALQWATNNSTTGAHVFKVIGISKQKEPESASQTFFLKSDTKPESYTFEIVKTFPHDANSFTQGLEWNNGMLYEGTGLNGKSKLMEIDPQTGKARKSELLDNEYFGEGITILNQQLFQLTWQSKKGFVYTLPDLKKIKEFGYPTDGWGLTHLPEKLAMSDGSNKIYFLNPETFASLGSIQVWDDRNPVSALNELETIDGAIFANKYQTDTLVKIDPKSGKVLAYIDLSNILQEKDRTGEEDVLNGIAYRSDEKLIYVTGKNYPKMFAIRLIKKMNI